MALIDDLVTWANERPHWQRAAIQRFCKEETYSIEEVSALADQLIAGVTPEAPMLTADDVPGGSSTGEQVILRSVHDVVGVNALLREQALSFAPTGMTIIFGNNGSGKSGYGRLLREAVKARVKGALLSNVFSQEEPEQNASLTYLVGTKKQVWSLNDPEQQSLASVRFYDSACGASYISEAEEITYRPYALTLLDRLQSLCRDLKSVIDEKIAVNGQSFPDLPELTRGTEARKFLDSLTSATSPAEIVAATTLAKDHTKNLAADQQEIARLISSNPNAEKARLARLAKHWEVVAKYLLNAETKVNSKALEDVAAAKRSAIELREAANAASAEQFGAEAIYGVGSESWRALWEAAKEFSTRSAYPEHAYPHTDDGAVCVLCHQTLSESAAERLKRFEKFVADSTSRKALRSEARLEGLLADYTTLASMPSGITEALASLSSEKEDTPGTVAWIKQCNATAAAVEEWILDRAEALPGAITLSPKGQAEERSRALGAEAESIDTDSYGSALALLQDRVLEAEAQGRLSLATESLKLAVERMNERSKLDKAKQQTSTSGITQKATALTTEYATSVARSHFVGEAERLGLRRITLSPTRGRSSATLEHRPTLVDTTRAAAVGDVFSEGEQTALGLAGFLTEVELDDTKSAVVFDDPVTSLDAGRRSRVAKRLIELSDDRQVIVFTHEITFVNDLLKEAKGAGQQVAPRSIQRLGSKPGKVTEEFPWKAKDVPLRIDQLNREVSRFKREREDMTEDQYTREVRAWAGDLSETWERAVNLEIIDLVVDRGASEVKPNMLKILQRFNKNDHDVFLIGYGKVSGWAGRHDNAPIENFHAPDIEELESELQRVKEWHARVRRYKDS